MKTIISLTAISFLLHVHSFIAQNIGINGTGANAHPSALLDVDDAGTNTKGLLIPRLALTAINVSTPVTAPATSLLIYNTATASTGTNAVNPGYYYWDASKWVRFAYSASGSSSTAWDLLGNVGTNPTTNFLGTTDAQDLVFKTNNTEKIRILSNGNVGIGTTNPITKLDIRGVVSADAGSLLSPAYTFVGDVKTGIFQPTNGELAIVTSATSYGNDNYRARFSANEIRVGNNINTLDLGVESKFIIQGSENGPTSNFPFASLGFSNNSNQAGQTSAEIAKILCSSQDATANQGRLELQTKDGTVLATRVMIDKNGNVGIGTTAPSAKLDVIGRVQVSNVVDNVFGTLQGANFQDLIGTYAGWDPSAVYIAGYNAFSSSGGRTTTKIYFGGNAPTSNIKMMVDLNSGNVGINSLAPTEKLEVQGSVKIVDGTQGAGRVLTSDVNGKATWGTLGPQTLVGSVPFADLIQTQILNTYQYTGYSIVVPAGRSTVSAGIYTQTSDNSMNYYTCQLSGSSTVVGDVTGFSNLPGLCAVTANHLSTAVGTVVFYVNNTSGASKTLYLWGYAAAFTTGGTITLRGNSTAAEPYIIAAY